MMAFMFIFMIKKQNELVFRLKNKMEVNPEAERARSYIVVFIANTRREGVSGLGSPEISIIALSE